MIGSSTATVTGPIDRGPRVRELAHRGRPAPDVYRVDQRDAGNFRESISTLKDGNPYAAAVHVYDTADYADMDLYVTDDGRAGYALKGDEIVSVFSRPDSQHRGSAPALIASAVQQGGRRLDCFDTILPKIYAREGFTPVARLPWNDEYAPDGWDYQTFERFNHGRPDVVFMAYDPDAIDHDYEPGTGTPVDDYDEGVALVDEYLTRSPQTSELEEPR